METSIGATLGTLTALNLLSVPLPEPEVPPFMDYSDERMMASGLSVGKGAPNTVWIFPLFETVAPRNQLKVFCPGKSARVYIRTRKSNGNYGTFFCIMHWPISENPLNEWAVENVFRFTHMVEVV